MSKTKNLDSISNSVRCFVHNSPVVRPCQLGECPLNVDYEKVNNCVLVFMQRKSLQSLSPLDISLLTGMDLSFVKSSLNDSLVQLRSQSVKSDEVEISPSFDVLSEYAHSLDYESEEPISSQDEDSKSLLDIESKYQNYASDVYSWGKHRFKSLEYLSQALGVSKKFVKSKFM